MNLELDINNKIWDKDKNLLVAKISDKFSDNQFRLLVEGYKPIHELKQIISYYEDLLIEIGEQNE